MKCLTRSRRLQASWIFLDIFSPTKHPISTSTANHQLGYVRSEFHDTIKSNKLISTHIRCGDLDSALKVFEGIKHKTVVSWNSILAGFAKKPGKMREARQLFGEIPEPDTVSYNTMLACHVMNAGVLSAVEFFEKIPAKDAVSWNTMISGFAREGKMGRSREFFLASPVKNEVSWSAMISGYIECEDLESASELFHLAPVKSVVAWTAMITGYMKFGKVESAEQWFRNSPEKNVVTWNAMISGYVENCKSEEGLKLFRAMIGFGFKPNASTFSSVLLGCSELSLLQTGKQVHQVIHKSPLRNNTTASTAIISMYCKCGALDDAQNLFLEMAQKDVVSWNAMITGYAQHGAGQEAITLFNEMKRKGPKPNWVTFVAVLSACSHAGLVDVGVRYFDSMARDNGVEVKLEHYICMVDLLGRAGRLVEALDLVKKMPFKPEPAVFGTLLSACRTHKNLELAEYAAKNLLRFDPSNAAAYIQLANVYASVQKWDSVSEIWRLMKEQKATRTPGYSWIEINNAIHNFLSEDVAHPEISAIHTKLDELDEKMKRAGYTPDLESALRHVPDKQKARHLLHHSERLAMAYGLLKLPEGTAIRVFKNLRVCGDCHRAAMIMSALEKREIIVRDATRFHHFKNGVCSCGGYW